MKYRMAAFALLILAGAVAFAQQSQPQGMANPSPTTGKAGVASESTGMDAEQLKKIEDDWAKVALNKNAAELSKIEAPDYQFVMPDGKVRGRQEEIAALGTSNITESSVRDMNVRVFGDTGIVTGVAHMKGTENGKDVSGDYRFTDVFIKRNGQWQAVNTEATKLMP